MKTILSLSLSLIIVSVVLTGCGASDTIIKLRDPSLTEGCKVVTGGIKLGYFNQAGRAEVCVLKCTPTLPEDFVYDYNVPGCHVGINLKR